MAYPFSNFSNRRKALLSFAIQSDIWNLRNNCGKVKADCQCSVFSIENLHYFLTCTQTQNGLICHFFVYSEVYLVIQTKRFLQSQGTKMILKNSEQTYLLYSHSIPHLHIFHNYFGMKFEFIKVTVLTCDIKYNQLNQGAQNTLFSY